MAKYWKIKSWEMSTEVGNKKIWFIILLLPFLSNPWNSFLSIVPSQLFSNIHILFPHLFLWSLIWYLDTFTMVLSSVFTYSLAWNSFMFMHLFIQLYTWTFPVLHYCTSSMCLRSWERFLSSKKLFFLPLHLHNGCRKPWKYSDFFPNI